MNAIDIQCLRAAIDVAERARQHGNHPFGAVLADKNGILVLEAENTVLTEKDLLGHAETNLVRQAARQFSSQALEQCTLYASTEPCPMCAGAIYWSGISRVVYGTSAQYLHALTGHLRATKLPACRSLLEVRAAIVVGPLLEEEANRVHEGFWK